MMARAIQENYALYDGFIICHGTDTLAYSAAALSYLIQNADKPIILTGAQQPISNEITDAKKNLRDSVVCALDPGSRGDVELHDRAGTGRAWRARGGTACAAWHGAHAGCARHVARATARAAVRSHAVAGTSAGLVKASVGATCPGAAGEAATATPGAATATASGHPGASAVDARSAWGARAGGRLGRSSAGRARIADRAPAPATAAAAAARNSDDVAVDQHRGRATATAAAATGAPEVVIDPGSTATSAASAVARATWAAVNACGIVAGVALATATTRAVGEGDDVTSRNRQRQRHTRACGACAAGAAIGIAATRAATGTGDGHGDRGCPRRGCLRLGGRDGARTQRRQHGAPNPCLISGHGEHFLSPNAGIFDLLSIV